MNTNRTQMTPIERVFADLPAGQAGKIMFYHTHLRHQRSILIF